jgi:hypothetical protein
MCSKLVFCVLLVCFVGGVALCQTPANNPGERRLAVGTNIVYYNPDLSSFNSGFTRLEQNYGLSPWKDYKMYYLVLPNIVYILDENVEILFQAGGSLSERFRKDGTSSYTLWMVGGEGRYKPFSWKKYNSDLFVVIGAGVIGAKFHRSYAHDIGITEFGSNLFLTTGVTTTRDLTSRFAVSMDIRYMFVPSINFASLNNKLSLGSFLLGVGCTYGL